MAQRSRVRWFSEFVGSLVEICAAKEVDDIVVYTHGMPTAE
jgi:hypothetical protein